jgi:hypothetical protein
MAKIPVARLFHSISVAGAVQWSPVDRCGEWERITKKANRRLALSLFNFSEWG